ncbi:MAG: gluconate 2-dehydrogenase subunit 3 family protein [Halioglobus sp.]
MSESYHIQQSIAFTEEPTRTRLTRRQSFKWLGAITAGLTLPLISGCEKMAVSAAKLAGHWPDLDLEPITGKGYGTDPNLITPPTTPWPLTMTAEQRELMSVLADILIPREGSRPSAAELNVTDVMDEWVSAPYPSFQSDRVEILSGLVWLDEESTRRFDIKFVQASPQQRLQIIDDIAYEKAESELQYAYIARVFDGVRTLVTIAYFGSPEGGKDLGYQGNVPIAGDYPGPTPEAIAHLDGVLEELGLADYAYS